MNLIASDNSEIRCYPSPQIEREATTVSDQSIVPSYVQEHQNDEGQGEERDEYAPNPSVHRQYLPATTTAVHGKQPDDQKRSRSIDLQIHRSTELTQLTQFKPRLQNDQFRPIKPRVEDDKFKPRVEEYKFKPRAAEQEGDQLLTRHPSHSQIPGTQEDRIEIHRSLYPQI